MRKLLLFLSMFQVMLAFAQVGVHTDTPDNSSAMDIVAPDRGLLIPRVTLTASLSNPSPVTSPAVGLLVFNSGANQAIGFYYWNGSSWTLIGSGGSPSGNYWSITGNSGTTPGTNFLGTTDNNHFLVYTNSAERMRFENDGQIIIDSIAPRNSTDLFTVIGNATQTTTVAAYPRGTGFYTRWGRYGLVALVDTAAGNYIGYGVYARNYDAYGYGLCAIGSNIVSFPVITNHTSGLVAYGYDGLQAWGRNSSGYGLFAIGNNQNAPYNISGVAAGVSAIGTYGIVAKGTDATTGRGIVAVGSNVGSPNTSNQSEGGAFTGFHGIYSRGTGYQAGPPIITGCGVIGVGYNQSTYSLTTDGNSLGGIFAGDYGVYGKGMATAGVGVLGVGSNSTGYYTITNGSGGAFTGYHGIISVGNNTTYGHGIVAAGNDGVYSIIPNGAGGSFTGTNIGAAGFATSSSGGTGVIGAGNNAGYLYYSGGSGGSFTGTAVGAIGYGTTAASGIGVIGCGNSITSVTLPGTSGCGGAFNGATYGVYGYASNSSSTRGGGYFACNPTSGGAYAYCGYRNGSTNYKTIGNGTNSTIVKNTKGDLITLYCPEAPEVVFQDYGVGQLVNGFAHISLDPDLTLNISVNQDHPIKVFITLEGDCNGVYVTNKSATGFDVVELQGGKSSVPFSWQIVATRANEQTMLKDGSIEKTVYDMRFGAAPGPLEEMEQDESGNKLKEFKTLVVQPIRSGEEVYHTTLDQQTKTLEVKKDTVIINNNAPDE
jgi:hypothetical protein